MQSTCIIYHLSFTTKCVRFTVVYYYIIHRVLFLPKHMYKTCKFYELNFAYIYIYIYIFSFTLEKKTVFLYTIGISALQFKVIILSRCMKPKMLFYNTATRLYYIHNKNMYIVQFQTFLSILSYQHI